jgi:hypothetical protein
MESIVAMEQIMMFYDLGRSVFRSNLIPEVNLSYLSRPIIQAIICKTIFRGLYPKWTSILEHGATYLSIWASASTSTPCLDAKHVIEDSTHKVMVQQSPGLRMLHHERKHGQLGQGWVAKEMQIWLR